MAENNAAFTISGIDSEVAARSISEELEDLDGVMGATVDHQSGEAEVRYDYDLLSEEAVKDRVRESGYEVE